MRMFSPTYDPDHRDPHAESSTEPLAHKESQDATRESAKVVDADDYTLESAAGVSKCIQPVLVAHDSGEHSLVITEED